jgi:hypothetical protein
MSERRDAVPRMTDAAFYEHWQAGQVGPAWRVRLLMEARRARDAETDLQRENEELKAKIANLQSTPALTEASHG